MKGHEGLDYVFAPGARGLPDLLCLLGRADDKGHKVQGTPPNRWDSHYSIEMSISSPNLNPPAGWGTNAGHVTYLTQSG